MTILPEIQLILFFLSALGNPDANDPPPETDDIDWNLFIDLSIRHKVLLLIYKSIIQEDKIGVPNTARDRFKSYYLNNLQRTIVLSSKLVNIIEMLDTNKIPCIPFKGPVLAQISYGDLFLRQFYDLDLLISAKDVLQTIHLFLNNGFTLQINIDEDQFDNYLQINKSIEIFNRTSGISVDLHWEFTGNYSILPFDLEYTGNRLTLIKFLNLKIQHLSKSDLAACLCLHGAKNKWDIIENIFCLSMLFKQFNTDDYDCLDKISADKKCQKAVGLGMYLSIYFFETPIPCHVTNHFFKFPDIENISGPIIRKLTSVKKSEDYKSSRFSWFNIAIRDCLPDKIRYGFRLLFMPSSVDWNTYRLSKNYTFLYHILRPARLFKNWYKNRLASFLLY